MSLEKKKIKANDLEKSLEYYFDRLWPLTRSITGEANRETLAILSEIIPLNIHEVPSGTTCFDWTVPEEWNPKEAWIKDAKGNTLVDFKVNNLHLLGYSTSFTGKVTFEELKSHLYTQPEQPDRIPYVTSYYQKRWGFCVSHNQYLELEKSEGKFEICIDTEHDTEGSLTYGDLILEGESKKEVLLSTYICHPSMANDQISGMLVAAFVYRQLAKMEKRHYTYRFVFAPETIGAIAYLKANGNLLKEKTVAGYVLTCLGDRGNFSYKKTREDNSLTDRIVAQVFKDVEKRCIVHPFVPMGSDERQYSSPGFNLPIGSLMRTMYWHFDEYHTSADNKGFISFSHLRESIEMYFNILFALDGNRIYINHFPYGEVQLGKHDLYPTLGRGNDKSDTVHRYLWILNLADGNHDVMTIAKRSGFTMGEIIEAAQVLEEKGLLKIRED